jgi:ElaA protein
VELNQLHWHIKTWEELSKEELYAILTLRTDVFIIEQNCPYMDTDGKDLKSLHLFAADKNNQVHACIRLVKPGVSYLEWAIGRVATSQGYRRSGLGKELMQRGMDYLKKEYSSPDIRISAQCYLKKFYSDFGFLPVGEEYLEDDIPHIEMLYHCEIK